uniref:Uncharacterized protein n=1 Tax=Rhizophora mucronata TaxID=61149 RepID=A0A2P2N3Y3_RHIMU
MNKNQTHKSETSINMTKKK